MQGTDTPQVVIAVVLVPPEPPEPKPLKPLPFWATELAKRS